MIGDQTVLEIVRAVAASMASLPVSVYYGKERFSRYLVDGNRVQFEEFGQDSYGPPPTQRSSTTPSVGHCNIALQVLIEGRDERSGATEHDHRGLVRELARIVFAVMVESLEGRAQPLVGWSATGGFVDPGEEIESGARYVLSLSVQTSIKRSSEMLVALAGTLTTAGVVRATVNGETQDVCGGP